MRPPAVADATSPGVRLTHMFMLLVIMTAIASPRPVTAQSAWTVSQTSAVSIGDGVGEGQDLYSVRDATVAPDGRILVLEGGTTVRVYSAQGAFLVSVGREGLGPGEFTGATTLRVNADGRLLVYDYESARVTTFGSDVELEDTQSMLHGFAASIPHGGSFRPFTDGSVLFARLDLTVRERMNRRRAEVHEDDMQVYVHDGDRSRLILNRPRGQVYQVPGLRRPVPFEEGVLVATGAQTVVLGTSHDTLFQRFDLTGELVGEYMATGSTRPVTNRDWEAYQDWLHAELANPISLPGVGSMPDPSSKVDDFLAKTPRGNRMPIFDDLQLDDENRLWAREYSLHGDMVTWQVVAPEGHTLGRVEMPRDWKVFEFTDNYVLALVRDEFDVEIVRKYRIER